MIVLALCLGLLPGAAWAAETEPATQAAGVPTRTERLLLYEMEETVENTEGGWKWEPNTNTLTLTNCHIKMNTERIIEFPDVTSARLVLDGENIIESGTTFNPIIASQTGGMEHLTISGTGILTVNAATGGNRENGSHIIGCQSITAEEGVTIRSNVDFATISKNFTMNGGYLEIEAITAGMF